MAIVGEVDESVGSRGCSQSGASLGMRWVMVCMAGCRRCRQLGNGMVRSLASALPNCVSQGQTRGRCRVRRRAERVSRPAREKKRRLRVSVVTTCSARPMRAVQRAMLWAITKKPLSHSQRSTSHLTTILTMSISSVDWGLSGKSQHSETLTIPAFIYSDNS